MKKNEPELIIKSQPLDFELTKLLGGEPSDFLVLCFDGVEFEAFGTPYDTQDRRAIWRYMVDSLNDRSKESMWPKLFKEWKPQICKQFGLPDDITHKQYHPVVSFKISRVCHGYSEYLHCAVGLFETLANKIASWTVRQGGGSVFVEVVTIDGVPFQATGEKAASVISAAIRNMLKHSINL